MGTSVFSKILKLSKIPNISKFQVHYIALINLDYRDFPGKIIMDFKRNLLQLKRRINKSEFKNFGTQEGKL